MQLHRERDALRDRGASLYLIGIGPPTAIAGFREDTGVTTPVFADPARATHRALAMRHGVTTFLSVRFLRHAGRARRAGYRNVAVLGDPVQHGGVLVVRRDAAIAYRYHSTTAGDHPPVADVLAAL